MITELNCKSYELTDIRTYLLAIAFIAGNIILPQLCHSIPNGGLMFLPIYFFTLIGAYRYGWAVGLITAICSPLINHLLFGMPMLENLHIILIKSALLAVTAALVSRKTGKISIIAIALVVIISQGIGLIGEGLLINSFNKALSNMITSIPGILIQIFGGYFVIKYILK